MYNRRVVGVGVGVIVLVGLVIGLRTRKGNGKETPENTPTTASVNSTGTSPFASIAPTSPAAAHISTPEQQKRFMAAFATPISFYGRVVDQQGMGIPSADIKIAANDKAMGGRPSEYTLQSDATGLFSISDITGLTLSVEVSKPGYQVIPPADGKVTSSGVFEYGLSSNRGPHHPQKDAPVLFILRKPGSLEPLDKVGEKNFPLQRDGTPLVIALDRGSQHKVIVRCWNNELQSAKGQRQYDWRFEIDVLNGGLVPRAGFDTEAPLGEYVSQDVIEMSASLPADVWKGFVERSYFFKFHDQTFARAKLEMHAGGDHFLVWESLFNPKPGSRNLEDATPGIR